MGKKKNKKKDAEKKEILKAKKAAKLNKKQTKKQKKAAKELGEEHIDSLVKEFNVTNMDEDKKTNVVIKENVSRPGPRCYANFTALPTGEICLFGGEYFFCLPLLLLYSFNIILLLLLLVSLRFVSFNFISSFVCCCIFT